MKKGLLILSGLVLLGGLYFLNSDNVYADDIEGDWKGMDYGGRGLEVKAEFFGMSVEDLRTALEDKTPLELAQEQGKTHEDLHNFMQEKARERMGERGMSEDEINGILGRRQERYENCTANPEECLFGIGLRAMGHGIGGRGGYRVPQE